MTTVAEPRTTVDDAPPVRVEKKISRAEGWRRRGPLLPALIFSIVVTQIPFLFTLYYSTQVVEPSPAGIAALQRVRQLHRGFQGQSVSGSRGQHGHHDRKVRSSFR